MGIQTALRPGDLIVEQATEVLIREARRRQHRRWLIVAGMVLILAAAGVLTITMEREGSGLPARSPHLKSPANPVVAPGVFIGAWRVHTTEVTIEANGQGSATWPGRLHAGQSIATAAPGHAELRVMSVNGSQAIAMVTNSTEPSVLPDGLARLRVAKYDLLYFNPAGATSASQFGQDGFCGPSALTLTVTQQVAAGINCGA
jgi:hypothetical protein